MIMVVGRVLFSVLAWKYLAFVAWVFRQVLTPTRRPHLRLIQGGLS